MKLEWLKNAIEKRTNLYKKEEMYNYETIQTSEETFVRIYTKESGFNIYDYEFFNTIGKENGYKTMGIYYCKIDKKVYMLLAES